MSRSVVVPDDLYIRAAELAAQNHVSVQQLVLTILTDGVASREFIESRARLFDRSEFKRALDCIPVVEPEAHDRI